MNTRSVTQKRQSVLAVSRRAWLLIGLLFAISALSVGPLSTQNLDGLALHELVLSDQGDHALQLLSEEALARGGWAPALGDVVVFVPNMVEFLMARTVAIDIGPDNCDLPRTPLVRKLEPPNPDCGRDFQAHQNEIQFGPGSFLIEVGFDMVEPRPLDDILSVYIEEVGHSWQEYCYETEGRCQGERTQMTTWGQGMQLASGWEYQVKMYILGLDGNLLHLSEDERIALRNQICDGYANPIYSKVLPYGPPDSWADPEAWPLAAPSLAEYATFCDQV